MEIQKVPWFFFNARTASTMCFAHFNPRYCKEETMPNLEEFKRRWVKGSATDVTVPVQQKKMQFELEIRLI
jgi:hypothetical protein